MPLTTPLAASGIRRVAAAVTVAAVSAAPIALAAPATAETREPTCTISAADRVVADDTMHSLLGRLAGHKPTVAEKKALQDAVKELVQTTKDATLGAAQRKAKKAEAVALAHELRTAKTAEERSAIRAERRAIRLELRTSTLTRAEKRALVREIQELRSALRAEPTRTEKKQLRLEVRVLRERLRCTTV